MKILTKEGISFLQALRTDILTLQLSAANMPAESKEKPKQMTNHPAVQAAVNVLDILINNNELNYWRKPGNGSQFYQELQKLGCDAKTYVPSVFDAVTCKLAEIMLSALNKFSMKEHVKNMVRMAGFLGGMNIETLQENIAKNLAFQIKLHEQLVLQNNSALTQFNSQSENWQKTTEQAVAAFVSPVAEAKDAVADQKKQFEEIQLQYQQGAKQVLATLSGIPYLRVVDRSTLAMLAAEKKAAFPLQEAKLENYRFSRIKDLLMFEQAMNAELQKHKSPYRFDYLLKHFKERYDNTKKQALTVKLASIVQTTSEQLEKFKGKKANTKLFTPKDFIGEIHAFLCVNIPQPDGKAEAETLKRCHPLFLKKINAVAEMRIEASHAAQVNPEAATEGYYKNLLFAAVILERGAHELFLVQFSEMNEGNDIEVMRLLQKADPSWVPTPAVNQAGAQKKAAPG